MEPAVLTRKAKAETPLQAKATHNVLTLKHKITAAPSTRLAASNHPTVNHTRLPSKERDPFFTSFSGKGLALVPVEQETLSEEEAEKLLYVHPHIVLCVRSPVGVSLIVLYDGTVYLNYLFPAWRWRASGLALKEHRSALA
jgi:hypothetical protein